MSFVRVAAPRAGEPCEECKADIATSMTTQTESSPSVHCQSTGPKPQRTHPVDTEKLSGPWRYVQLLPLVQELVLKSAHGWMTGRTTAGIQERGVVERQPKKEKSGNDAISVVRAPELIR